MSRDIIKPPETNFEGSFALKSQQNTKQEQVQVPAFLLFSLQQILTQFPLNFSIGNGFICNFLSQYHLSPEHQALTESRTNRYSITSLVVQHPWPQILASLGKENAPNDTHASQQPPGVLGRGEVTLPAPKTQFISYLAISWHAHSPYKANTGMACAFPTTCSNHILRLCSPPASLA